MQQIKSFWNWIARQPIWPALARLARSAWESIKRGWTWVLAQPVVGKLIAVIAAIVTLIWALIKTVALALLALIAWIFRRPLWSRAAAAFARWMEAVGRWIRNHPWWAVVILLLLILLAPLLRELFSHFFLGNPWANWTGFGEYTGLLTKGQRGKTLWDWMGILLGVIAIVLLVWLNESNQKRRKQIELEISADQQREQVLRTYVSKMEDFLLVHNLKSTKAKKDSKSITLLDVAQACTITTLRALDRERKSSVFQFLRDSGLGDFLLAGTALSGIDLSGTDIHEINLQGADLSGVDLSGANVTSEQLAQAKSLKGARMPDDSIHL